MYEPAPKLFRQAQRPSRTGSKGSSPWSALLVQASHFAVQSGDAAAVQQEQRGPQRRSRPGFFNFVDQVTVQAQIDELTFAGVAARAAQGTVITGSSAASATDQSASIRAW